MDAIITQIPITRITQPIAIAADILQYYVYTSLLLNT